MYRKQKIILKTLQKGTTLLEILIATSIGSALVMLTLVFYSSCTRYYLMIRSLSEEIETGRYACFFLRNKVSSSFKVRGLLKDEMEYQALKVKKYSDAFEISYLMNNQLTKMYLYISESISKYNSRRNELKSFGLFLKQMGKPRIEVASTISNLKILYGLKCPGSNDVCQYAPVSQITDWSKVIAMDIVLKSEQCNKKWRTYIAFKKNP